MHGVLRFWLDRGVDGFRIDVVHKMLKDPGLRDNPLLPGREGHGYGSQRHVHDDDHPDVHEALRAIRRVLDAYDERMAVGEVYVMDPEAVARYYGRGDELNLAFNFLLTVNRAWDAAVFRREVERFEALVPPDGWPVWVLSSHDAPRHASRFDDPEHGEARARVAAVWLLTVRATPFLYYGEEIGMRNGAVPEDRLRDPLAWTLHPKLSRDPERTPMQWEPGPGAGFTRGEPWLPIGADADARNAARQRDDRGSLAWLYKDLLALRRATPALHRGAFAPLAAPEGVFAFERRHAGQRAAVALNFTDAPREVSLGRGAPDAGLRSAFGAPLPRDLAAVELAPNEGLVVVQGAA
jgi:alpha-glucosidase